MPFGLEVVFVRRRWRGGGAVDAARKKKKELAVAKGDTERDLCVFLRFRWCKGWSCGVERKIVVVGGENDSDLYATLSLVSVAGVVVMVIAFSLGLGAMPWIIMSEILPINIKGLAGSFATLANWFFSWLVTLTANLLLDWSSGGTFTIYTAVCVFTAGFVAIWVPETKGKTLEEIQQFFR
ncbi:hypothetical protein KIW84_074294 [Lathyrus oleraceus]|uniref:Major facilitator superfamily (MFS) profile domain-containing protein n=1 Tax=Pisum sativum TaxID=3888 RepID=A0A9D5A0A4_PEA|nr:hypothetical protein KIW84_074294 [Pisum sativum]